MNLPSKPLSSHKLIIFSILFISLLTACAKRQEDPQSVDDEIYTAVEHSAEFPGGIDAFYAYLQANIHYPQRAIQDKVQGRVFITFIVEKDGSITNVEVLRGIGDGCDEEAVRVIKASPNGTRASKMAKL